MSPPAGRRNGSIAAVTASRAAASPALRIALIAGPDESNAVSADSRSANVHGHETSAASPGMSPASVANPSSAPADESANGPGAPGGGGGISGPRAAR